VVIYEVNGLNGRVLSDILDVSHGTNSASGSALSSGAVSTTSAVELWVGTLSSDPGLTGVTGTFTNTIASGSFMAGGVKIASATGSLNYTGTQSGSNIWAACAASFKVGPGNAFMPDSNAGPKQAVMRAAVW
jgi:hypothetical protein